MCVYIVYVGTYTVLCIFVYSGMEGARVWTTSLTESDTKFVPESGTASLQYEREYYMIQILVYYCENAYKLNREMIK